MHARTGAPQGVTGVAGTTGWFMRFNAGAPPYVKIFITQLPPWASMVWATRYPPGTTFSIARVFQWYPALSSPVTQAGSLQEVLAGGGDRYFWDGNMLYIRFTDPGGTWPWPGQARRACVH